MRMNRFMLVVLIGSATSCAEIQNTMCVDGLKEHFAAARSFTETKPSTVTEYRTALAQMKDLLETADTNGCKSQMVFAINELKSGVAELQAATSDGQMLVHGLFELFDAGNSSPLSQEAKAAQTRIKGAIKILDEAGIHELD